VSRWIGSWLSGSRAALEPTEGSGGQQDQQWRGERLGLPESGPGSVATLGSRGVALLIDAILAAFVAGLFTAPRLPQNWSLLSWFLITVVAVSFFGFTPGMGALGIRVVRMDGAAMVGPIRAIPRTIMAGLILPVLFMNADGRGLHDRVTGTIVLRFR
jgi:uncharacterized RDD family membrane protein YckC